MNKTPTVSQAQLCYDTFIVFNDKGGTRKSTFLVFLWALLLIERCKPMGFEIDQQKRIVRLYKNMRSLVLPEVEQFAVSETADTAILTPLMAALEDPERKDPLLVEIGANLSDRVATVLGADPSLAQLIDQSGRKIALLLMMDGQEDTVTSGCHAARLLQYVLPTADLFLVQREADLNIGSRVRKFSQDAQNGYEDIIVPAQRDGRVLIWPDMSNDVRRAYTGAGLNPVAFRKLEHAEIGRLVHPSDAGEDVWHYVGRRTMVTFNIYLGKMLEEAVEKLGFRGADDA